MFCAPQMLTFAAGLRVFVITQITSSPSGSTKPSPKLENRPPFDDHFRPCGLCAAQESLGVDKRYRARRSAAGLGLRVCRFALDPVVVDIQEPFRGLRYPRAKRCVSQPIP